MKKLALVLVPFLSVLAIAFAVLVWPTRYETRELRHGDSTRLVRIDRFGGQAEYLSQRSGWLPLDTAAAASKSMPPATAEECAQFLAGNPYIEILSDVSNCRR